MAMYKGIEQQLNKAVKNYEEAKRKLKEFEEGEDDGLWLKELRRKTRRNDLSEEEKQEKKRLEKKEEELTRKEEDRLKQVEKLQDALVELSKKGEGNEQIV